MLKELRQQCQSPSSDAVVRSHHVLTWSHRPIAAKRRAVVAVRVLYKVGLARKHTNPIEPRDLPKRLHPADSSVVSFVSFALVVSSSKAHGNKRTATALPDLMAASRTLAR